MTPNSTTSKPSTESDTAIRRNRWFRLGARPQRLPEFDELLNLYWGGPERRITGLTVRIIGVNAAALVILVAGILYLGQYQNALIETKLETFKSEVELAAAALAEGTTNEDARTINLEQARRMVWRLSQTTGQHIYLFDSDGHLAVNSANIAGYAALPHFAEEKEQEPLYTIRILKGMARFILSVLPASRSLPLYPDPHSQAARDYPDASEAIEGAVSISAWKAKDESVILAAAAPLYGHSGIFGAALITQERRDIGQDIGEVWLNIVSAFLMTLFITVLLSIYLSGVIARPLRRLAKAAEGVRTGRSKDSEIPDLSARKDEIGELSIVLREMTQALWDRMDTIERFAADVAHELKNPLTSLRSALETAAIVKKDADREKLMQVMQHDVERMDRLISDISGASRLDAELSREALAPVDLKATLRHIIGSHQNSLSRSVGGAAPQILLDAPEGRDVFVWGREMWIFQVFDNLIANALSFSAAGKSVTISVIPTRKTVRVRVEDEGPGIPENKLETVFERFYTERPQHEAYGEHSGLGLSICRQIVNALGGRIYAENARDGADNTTGARFWVILNTAPGKDGG